MKFKVTGRVIFKGNTPKEEKIMGLGDVVAKFAEPIKRAAPKLFKNCKCKARQEWLNKHFPL